MTHEREAAGHDGIRPRSDHQHGVVSRRLWRRRVVVVDDDDSSFHLGARSTDDLLGWSAADLGCAPYAEFVHPDDRELLADAADALHAAGPGDPCMAFRPLELRVLARDRVYWWTRWHVALTPDEAVACAIGVEYIAPDVTTGPPMGTWRWDSDADTVSWSTELLEMLGLTVGPPASYDAFLAVVLEDDRDAVDRAVRVTGTSGEPYVVDFRVAGRDGRERWFHAAGRRMSASAEVPGGIAGIVKYLNPTLPHPSVPRSIGSG